MSNPTSNFGWQMPTATDLVTDLPADFEVFGQAVDTALMDLKGGTTGQILAKNTNTDMDFVWITNDVGDITAVTAGTGITGGGTSGAVTITNDMATTITASGDIVVGTGSGTYDNLPIGTTGQILTADTTVSPYKVKWATPAGASQNFSLISSAALTGATTITISGISGMNSLWIHIFACSSANASSVFTFRMNADSAANYLYGQGSVQGKAAYNSDIVQGDGNTGDTSFPLNTQSTATSGTINGGLTINGCNSAGYKVITGLVGANNNGGATGGFFMSNVGAYKGTSTISSISIISSTGNFDNGTIYVYGSA